MFVIWGIIEVSSGTNTFIKIQSFELINKGESAVVTELLLFLVFLYSDYLQGSLPNRFSRLSL